MGAVTALLNPYQLRFGQCCRELLSILGIQDFVIAAPYHKALLLDKRDALADCIPSTLNESDVCLSPTCNKVYHQSDSPTQYMDAQQKAFKITSSSV